MLGKHSGRNALSSKLKALGYELKQQELDDVFKRFKALADKKKTIGDEDLLALVGDEVHQPEVVWEISDLQVRARGALRPRLGGRRGRGCWRRLQLLHRRLRCCAAAVPAPACHRRCGWCSSVLSRAEPSRS